MFIYLQTVPGFSCATAQAWIVLTETEGSVKPEVSALWSFTALAGLGFFSGGESE